MSIYTLRVRNLSKHYEGNRVLNQISITHDKGVLGIAGPNGSGKSTLLQCIGGLQRPSSGSVEWYENEECINITSLREHIGYAAPYINLYTELSCTENIEFLMKLHNNKYSQKSIRQVLNITGIEELGLKSFGHLSTGQQQRLRLAAALVHKPNILLLDEPGSNLDKEGRNLIESMVADFREAHRPVIIASNNPAELELCDRVYSVKKEMLIDACPL